MQAQEMDIMRKIDITLIKKSHRMTKNNHESFNNALLIKPRNTTLVYVECQHQEAAKLKWGKSRNHKNSRAFKIRSNIIIENL